MTITALYAGLIGLLLMVLSTLVIMFRTSEKVSLGDGGNVTAQRRIRAQANLAEYAPVALILIGLLEYAGYGPVVLHLLGAAFVIGRLLHGWALAFTKRSAFGRISGMILTMAVIIVAAVLNVVQGLAALSGS